MSEEIPTDDGGGEKVHPDRVEEALSAHPAIAESTVISVPRDLLGEEIVAVVVLRPGSSVTAEELVRDLGYRLEAHEVPRNLWFHSGPLPRNAQGEVLKPEDLPVRLRGDP